MKFRSFVGAVVAFAISASSTFAADVASAPLPAGKPSGVRQAAMLGLNPGWLISLGFSAVGIAAAAGAFNKSKSSSSTGTSS
jgi:hypothetical protein